MRRTGDDRAHVAGATFLVVTLVAVASDQYDKSPVKNNNNNIKYKLFIQKDSM